MRNQEVVDALFAYDKDSMSRLMDQGKFNVNEGIDYGRMALSICAACDYTELIDFLVSKGADVNKNNDDDTAYTPLEEASREGKLASVKLLLKLGADINKGNSINSNALIGACIAAKEETVKLLIEHGANVNHRDNRGQTALHYLSFYVAQWAGNSYEITVNGKTETCQDPRYKAYLDIYKYLIGQGADVGLLTNYGYTPLHLAAESNSADFIEILVSNGADVNTPNSKGFTPLHAAADNGSLESLRLLIKHGANVNAVDSYGFTPLISAIANGNTDMVKFMLKHHALTDIKVKQGHGKVEAGDDAITLASRLGNKSVSGLLKM